MAWDNIDEMFPSGGTLTDMGYLTNQEIVSGNYDKVCLTLTKPVRQMVERIETFEYYSDGSINRMVNFTVLPLENIDDRPLMNVYGQKIMNDIIRERMMEEDLDGDCGLDYTCL
jgi:hypothetical protein